MRCQNGHLFSDTEGPLEYRNNPTREKSINRNTYRTVIQDGALADVDQPLAPCLPVCPFSGRQAKENPQEQDSLRPTRTLIGYHEEMVAWR